MNEWVWDIGGMILTRKLKYWEKNSVGRRWMNEYGALVEWWQETLQYREKNQIQCHFVQHKSHLELNLAVRSEKRLRWTWIQLVPHSKHSVSIIKTNQLMLYREIISVCSVIRTEHTNTPFGQNVEFLFYC